MPKNPLISSDLRNWKGGVHPLMPAKAVEDATKQYRDTLDSNLQERLLEAAETVRQELSQVLGQRVHLLFPPKGSKTQVPGEEALRKLKGEKKFPEAEFKVVKDYKGNWGDIKDLARCTLAMEDPVQPEDKPFLLVQKYFAQGLNGFTIKETKVVDPKDMKKNPCGYSGYTVFVKDGRFTGEIQVNYMNMMYAKSQSEFTFGQDKERELRRKYPLLPGFLGHHLYEIYRVNENNDKGKQAARASRVYYSYFRSKPANPVLGTVANWLVKTYKLNAALPEPPALPWLDKSFEAALANPKPADPNLPPQPERGRLGIDTGPALPVGGAPSRLQPGDFKQLFGVDLSTDW